MRGDGCCALSFGRIIIFVKTGLQAESLFCFAVTCKLKLADFIPESDCLHRTARLLGQPSYKLWFAFDDTPLFQGLELDAWPLHSRWIKVRCGLDRRPRVFNVELASAERPGESRKLFSRRA